MIKSNKIINLKVVENILIKLKEVNKYIDNFNEDSFEYEHLCENIQEQLCEIEEALIGAEQFNEENRFRATMRINYYWNYLRNEISFNELLTCLKKNSDKLLLQ